MALMTTSSDATGLSADTAPTGVTPIVALDVPDLARARAIVEQLGDSCAFYKVGLELFAAEGPAVVTWLRGVGKEVFVDLKLGDMDGLSFAHEAHMLPGLETLRVVVLTPLGQRVEPSLLRTVGVAGLGGSAANPPASTGMGFARNSRFITFCHSARTERFTPRSRFMTNTRPMLIDSEGCRCHRKLL